MNPPDLRTLRQRLEPGRLLLGWVIEMFAKAWGAGAATAAALSGSETVLGKARDALLAIPTLTEEYRKARYAMEHREEIQEAADYLSAHTPPQAELEAATDDAVGTMRDIVTVQDELAAAWDASTSWPLSNPLPHLGAARDAMPDSDSIGQVIDLARQAGPLAEHAQVLVPVYYGSFMRLTDNFASDEIVGTLLVMGLALVIASTIGRVLAFWVRRGRPGFLAHLMQGWGATRFRGWYVDNMPHSMSPPLHAAARERLIRDIVADPEGELDPDALRALSDHFGRRRARPSQPQ